MTDLVAPAQPTAALDPSAPPTPPAPPAPAPRRPALDPATRRPTLIVAAIIGALFFGSPVINESLPGGTEEVAAGETIVVGEAVTFTAAGGWEATPHESGGGVRLEKGIVVLDVFPEPVTTDAAVLAQAYLEQVLREEATELTSTDIEPAADGTAGGARFRYQGLFPGAEGPIEGEVTTIVSGGNGVVADAWSRQGDLDSLIEEVREMVGSIQVEP